MKNSLLYTHTPPPPSMFFCHSLESLLINEKKHAVRFPEILIDNS